MTRLAKELAALPSQSQQQLRERWQQPTRQRAPAVPTAILRRLVAHRLQERHQGSVPALVLRELEQGAPATAPAKSRAPKLTPHQADPGVERQDHCCGGA